MTKEMKVELFPSCHAFPYFSCENVTDELESIVYDSADEVDESASEDEATT